MSEPPDRPCKQAVEFCTDCGRPLESTIEIAQGHQFSERTGERLYEVWHSCPRYFGNLLVRILTLGLFGVGWGHDSHLERNPIVTRKWG